MGLDYVISRSPFQSHPFFVSGKWIIKKIREKIDSECRGIRYRGSIIYHGGDISLYSATSFRIIFLHLGKNNPMHQYMLGDIQ